MRLLSSEPKQLLSNDGFQCLDPFRQRYSFWRERDEQVHVIRHYDVPANGYIVFLCTFAKGTEGFMDVSARE